MSEELKLSLNGAAALAADHGTPGECKFEIVSPPEARSCISNDPASGDWTFEDKSRPTLDGQTFAADAVVFNVSDGTTNVDLTAQDVGSSQTINQAAAPLNTLDAGVAEWTITQTVTDANGTDGTASGKQAPVPVVIKAGSISCQPPEASWAEATHGEDALLDSVFNYTQDLDVAANPPTVQLTLSEPSDQGNATQIGWLASSTTKFVKAEVQPGVTNSDGVSDPVAAVVKFIGVDVEGGLIEMLDGDWQAEPTGDLVHVGGNVYRKGGGATASISFRYSGPGHNGADAVSPANPDASPVANFKITLPTADSIEMRCAMQRCFGASVKTVGPTKVSALDMADASVDPATVTIP